LRIFIFVLRRNLCLQPLLNLYMNGSPERQKKTSLARRGAGPGDRKQAGRDGGVMKNWMLGAAMVVAGGLGMGATSAQAAEFGIYARGPAAYVPPCPGPGYFWIAGYQANGYWIPGRWDFRGGREREPFARFDHGRDYDRHFDRDHDRDWGRDHDRGRR
jgi:hypothetical protein